MATSVLEIMENNLWLSLTLGMKTQFIPTKSVL